MKATFEREARKTLETYLGPWIPEGAFVCFVPHHSLPITFLWFINFFQ